jgi:hypothetical protein
LRSTSSRVVRIADLEARPFASVVSSLAMIGLL